MGRRKRRTKYENRQGKLIGKKRKGKQNKDMKEKQSTRDESEKSEEAEI